ncbi:MAG: bifunctional hydroxymethylpyrimidine kinase/phosphomethylpyrimidine kinase [bacterium]
MKRALAISGFDPTGGAGILLDIKVFSRFEVYGYGVITAYTVQTPRDVLEIKPQDASTFRKALQTLLYHLSPNAVKIGMLASSELVNETAMLIKRFSLKNIVLDPILKSKNGYPLITDEGIKEMIYRLFPLVALVMPNADEISTFTGMEVKNIENARIAVREFYKSFKVPVLLKGGHLDGEPVDIFYDGNNLLEFGGKRKRNSPHGTGCLLSAACTAILAKGTKLDDAIAGAKKFTAMIIKSAGNEPLLPL